jgi:hypothetical protein
MVVTIALFLTLIAATLVFGCWLGVRWARAGREIDTVLAEHRRGCAVSDDEADAAETADDWKLR